MRLYSRILSFSLGRFGGLPRTLPDTEKCLHPATLLAAWVPLIDTPWDFLPNSNIWRLATVLVGLSWRKRRRIVGETIKNG